MSSEAARKFEFLANQCVEAGASFSVALSGGSTPRRLYELLATPDVHLPWARIHVFQVDERCVPPDHPESNYRMLREALLNRVPIPQANVHRMAAERPDREEAAREYAAELARVLGPKHGGWPRLDLIFLGMGADGHTASLFPASPALDERRLAVRVAFSKMLNSHRLTLTLPVLNSAAETIFLVSGADKAEILREVLRRPPPPDPLPAQLIEPANGQLSWYVDRAAAGRL